MESIRVCELYENLWYKPFWLHYMFWYMLGIIFCITLGLIAWVFYKKKKTNIVVFPWDRALYDLEQLKPEHFDGYERRKEFYSEVTHILKIYLSARYSVNLLDKTDYESLKDLQYVIGSSQILEKLEGIMSGAVWAKFAPHDIIRQKMTEHLSECIAIVKNTKPSQTHIS